MGIVRVGIVRWGLSEWGLSGGDCPSGDCPRSYCMGVLHGRMHLATRYWPKDIQRLQVFVGTLLARGPWKISEWYHYDCQWSIPCLRYFARSLPWRHTGRDIVSNHQPHDYLINCSFRRRSKKTSKLRVTCFCAGNSPVTGEFPAQKASDAKNVSIWWRHHDLTIISFATNLNGHSESRTKLCRWISRNPEIGRLRLLIFRHGFGIGEAV